MLYSMFANHHICVVLQSSVKYHFFFSIATTFLRKRLSCSCLIMLCMKAEDMRQYPIFWTLAMSSVGPYFMVAKHFDKIWNGSLVYEQLRPIISSCGQGRKSIFFVPWHFNQARLGNGLCPCPNNSPHVPPLHFKTFPNIICGSTSWDKVHHCLLSEDSRVHYVVK